MRKSVFHLASTALVSLALAGTASAAMATPAPVPPPAPTCAADQVKVDLNAQPGGGMALLALTNQSDRACTVQGNPGVGFLAADNSPVQVPVQPVDQPGPGPLIELAPGNSAFAGVKWTPCDTADPNCFVATTVEVTSPGATAPVVADFHSANGGGERVTELPLSGAQVGTLQPITDGVVAW